MVGVYVLPVALLAVGGGLRVASCCACRRLRVYMLPAIVLAEKVGVYLLPVALLARSGCLHVVCYSGRRRVDVYMLPVTLLAGG